MTARLLKGDAKSIIVDVPGSTAIHPGDLMFLYSSDNYCYPANSTNLWSSNIGTTQAALHAKFVGIALDQRLVGQTAAGKIRVATAGTWEVTITATTQQEIGTMVGGAQDGANSYLLRSAVVVVTAHTSAIGRLVERLAANATLAKINIVTLVDSGAQAVAS